MLGKGGRSPYVRPKFPLMRVPHRVPTGQLMNPNYRNLALWAIIAVLLIALFNLFQTPPTRGASQDVPYSQFLQEVAAGPVKTVTIAGDRSMGTYTDNANGFQ